MTSSARVKRVLAVLTAAATVALLTGYVAPAGAQAQGKPHHGAGEPDLGPNVLVFDPSMTVADIKAAVDAVAAQQVGNEFGTERVALLFKPGTYGSATEPLNFQVGYYTAVAGLGQSPTDVVINGTINVYNQCFANGCFALNNFWRSLENLTINVTDPPGAGCYAGNFWAVSQAAPMRRINVTGGNVTLMDYCTPPSYASGGFIADSAFAGGTIISGSQQQWLVRNSTISGWTNGVWNQVFAGVNNAPATCFPAAPSCGGPYTTLATTPASREKPYLYVDGAGSWRVFVPDADTDSSGPTWTDGPTPGHSIPLRDFFIADPSDSAKTLDKQLARGKHLLLTPGVYDIDRTLDVKRPDTVVLGLGLATLTAQNGVTVLRVGDVDGVDIAGITVDAGPVSSKTLVEIGTGHGKPGKSHGHGWRGHDAQPVALQDVFFRIGGPHVGKAQTSLVVNADGVILDNIWAWRADHGSGVGWTVNTADTGVIVNGDDVTATGLFVEHYQKTELIWNGEGGRTVFFQNEMPYDPPSQDAWRQGSQLGYVAYRVAAGVQTHELWAGGSYSFFNQGIDIYASNAFQVPERPGIDMHNLLTVFLDPTNGSGGILNVINDTGGSSTIANPSVPVTVVEYP